jgi:hypothetical protein
MVARLPVDLVLGSSSVSGVVANEKSGASVPLFDFGT